MTDTAATGTVATIAVTGNVEGSIVVGNNNFVVNNNHGTIVQQAALPTQRRLLSPKPPRKPLGFVGRKLELQQVEEMISGSTPVIIHGIDGIGKTTLLKQAANSEVGKSQPDGVLLQEGLDEEGKLLDFEDLVQRLFVMLFESNPPIRADIASARTYLSNTKPLVLLNSISLSQSELDTLLDLFPSAPILIATEKGDRPDNYENITLGPLSREDAYALLAGSLAENHETYSRIADLVEYIPGAIIMVKKIINDGRLTADEACTRLQAYNPVEKEKLKAAEERAYALVLSTLTEDERGMVIQTAAAHGISVDRKWLESEYGGNAVSDKLESLELLQANSPRFRLMPGFRSFLLREQDVTKERERLLSHLLAELKTRWNDFEFIKDELGNLLGLLSWSAEKGQWANVAALGRAIDPYLTLRGLWSAWHKTLAEIQRAANSMQNPELQGWAFHQLGTYEIGSGNLDAARDLLKQAISIRASLGDQVGLAFSQHNLQFITPLIPPTSNNPPANPPANPPFQFPPFGNFALWVFGGLTVIAIATLIFMNMNRPAAPVVVPPIVTVAEITETPSPTQTAASTSTETPSPSPTITVTSTPSPTGTPTATPTYSVLIREVIAQANCRYGPGKPYLYKYGFRPGAPIKILGRFDTFHGPWFLIETAPPLSTLTNGPCWIDARSVDITEAEIPTVPLTDLTPLPMDRISRGIEIPYPVLRTDFFSRSGAKVHLEWEFYDVGFGELESETSPRYLVEAWVCSAGEIVFRPYGFGPWNGATTGMNVSGQIDDEPGCPPGKAHARLYLAWKHGYVGPVDIKPWP